jgi:hypothetical protein
MIPPEGFAPVATFSGFMQEATGASIMINEIPAPYASIAESFTASALAAKGMKLISQKKIQLNGAEARLLKISQVANGIPYLKTMLVFGDDSNTVLVNGIYPKASKAVEPMIEKALLSTMYHASQNENPLDAASFLINTESSNFKLVEYMSGSLLYSTDGKIPTDKPTIIVGNSIAAFTGIDRKEFALKRYNQLPDAQNGNVKETNDVTIDGLNGIEIVGYNKSKDATIELVYQLMLFTEGGNYFIFVGQAKEDLDENLKSFKAIAKTFKRK